MAGINVVRRSALAATAIRAALALACTFTVLSPSTGVAEDDWQTATALIGEPKYPNGFDHFEYVNPDAPKQGMVRLSANGTFDTLNIVPQRGNSGVGINLIYDTLMTSSTHELSTMYPLVAEAFRHPDDYSSVTFRLNKAAKWHDGMPITADDVVWSFNAIVEHNRVYQNYYRHVTSAEALDAHTVKFTFDEKGNKELPHIVGQVMILPKHWWEGNDSDGDPRDVSKGTLETPLGSGPYRMSRVVPARTIEYERVTDYWGINLPVNIGHNNFDKIRYEYYRDGTVELEAFKSDDFDYRVENTARLWATAYDIPAIRDGRIIKQAFDNRGSGLMVGFIPNMRLKKFQDVRVRRALNQAFDFEEMNKTIFYDQYLRINSYFYGDKLASAGLPTGLELEILETVRADVPESVFTQEYVNPVAGSSGAYRDNLREAVRLFREAGYVFKKGKMVNGETGEPFTIEFLLNGGNFEKIALRLKSNFARIGVGLSVRIVDSSQWVNRVRSRDFDMIYNGWGQSMSPGNEQLEYFGSEAADQESSRNWSGVQNPAVDVLIQRIIFAKDREELIAATKAMDRVLLANSYIIPGWTLRQTRTVRWDRFSHSDILPTYGEPDFPTTWWYDNEKAAKVEALK
ncbi:MAG: ABC transporter substrate-binding protein [Rhizobiales bacterium]|nr:ABC transporter substrate-binding protein [Hyphomicrobiales bacterium]